MSRTFVCLSGAFKPNVPVVRDSFARPLVNQITSALRIPLYQTGRESYVYLPKSNKQECLTQSQSRVYQKLLAILNGC